MEKYNVAVRSVEMMILYHMYMNIHILRTEICASVIVSKLKLDCSDRLFADLLRENTTKYDIMIQPSIQAGPAESGVIRTREL